MSKTIDVTCGIYNTNYRLEKNRKTGQWIVRQPYIKWNKSGSVGTLAFYKRPVNENREKLVLRMFELEQLWLPDSHLTLDDILDGY